MTTPQQNPSAPAAPTPVLPPNAEELIKRTVAAAMEPLEKVLARMAPSTPPAAPTEAPRSPITGKEMDEGTGLTYVRALICNAAAKLGGQQPNGQYKSSPAEIAKARGYIRVERILTQGTLSSGGSFVQDTVMVQEWIELLRNTTVVRRAKPRFLTIPGGGVLRLPRQTGAGAAYYTGETVAITASEQTTDQVAWSQKKLTSLCPISNELIRHAGIDAEMFVRDDLMNVMAIKEDVSFLRGTGTGNTPRGLRYLINSSNIVQETVASEGAPTTAEKENELQRMLKRLTTANVMQRPMARPTWFMSANPEYELKGTRDGNGNLIYEGEMLQGKLKGKPYFSTQQIPENLGGDGDESELYLVDMDSVVIVDFMTMEAEFFPNGTYPLNGQTISGIGTDTSVMRVISEHDINMRHDTAGTITYELSWGY